MCAISTTSIENLLKKAGATRVSEKAKKELSHILVRKATDVSEKSHIFAKHAGRKTVKREDIELALDSNFH